MPSIAISEAKAKLAALVREGAASGESYGIRVNGRPLAELRPFVAEPRAGRDENEIQFDDYAFDALSSDEAAAWGV
jgi:antitoxin (DNA-binding transcriptional repressor) of toxin-antitoxin stability system